MQHPLRPIKQQLLKRTQLKTQTPQRSLVTSLNHQIQPIPHKIRQITLKLRIKQAPQQCQLWTQQTRSLRITHQNLKSQMDLMTPMLQRMKPMVNQMFQISILITISQFKSKRGQATPLSIQMEN
jgi:hypothetical protein